jgi:Zn finger protein HypA/HybF involved in hydrogenase expression
VLVGVDERRLLGEGTRVMEVVPLHRSLEQELVALVRGVSLECLVCGEFVMRDRDRLRCPECGSMLRGALTETGSQLQFGLQAG